MSRSLGAAPLTWGHGRNQHAYRGDLRCAATHGPSGSELITDAPLDNHGKGEAFSPTDLTATSLGICMLTVIGIVAQKRGASLEGMTCRVAKEMTADPPRRIGKLAVVIRMPLAADDPAAAIFENAARHCPVHHSLHPDIEIDLRFDYAGSGQPG